MEQTYMEFSNQRQPLDSNRLMKNVHGFDMTISGKAKPRPVTAVNQHNIDTNCVNSVNLYLYMTVNTTNGLI